MFNKYFSSNSSILPSKGVPCERSEEGGGMLLPIHVRRFVQWRQCKSGFGKAIFDEIESAIKLDAKGNSTYLETYKECYNKEWQLLMDYYENTEKYQKLVKQLKVKYNIEI
jgi:hypothetical protein